MLNFEKKGNGKENLVLLHGFMENLSIWDDMEPHLSKDFTLIKIDLPGHGKSDILGEVHTMELMADEVKKVVDHEKLDKFHLLGHSMGGYTSLAFAEKFPENLKSLTLFFSTYFADDEEKKEQRIKSYRIIKDAFPHYVRAGIPNLFNQNERDVLEGKIEIALDIALSTNNLGALASVKGMVERTDKKHILENLEAKIVVIAGKHDNAVKTDKTINNLPDRTNIKSYILDCGHNGHWEKPGICAEIINTELLHHLPKKFLL
ncbi:2-hydroxy-6-oxononadienedioate/2-hydroxy-6-oxononatrienedioate hydrolase [Chryseobacterium aquaeductus]|uniref:2-hydroxy-6-oxononadienedioate/2-hydroxy-6-oxononatrienedioate hydrolase n=1 Tax=Chryseobacterium aquaeductus TaxID=2675056 RepID=A0A9N8MNP8_9FLAO|nr:alpha/beta hydrolase [Chryseobacterium aquaeductus]CAA7331222.1 2-hydroxy-6-oxononadienedioate/2-hydroxy-6-oxononatrienedioate hydrolase [Chryseobacterium potabilaquae]CAD7808910.1 2-hydroxy-6-oxononadienedioate/2-hydroxy-6-oxononatrienedioate hydrolase [Chryseobacterium aquaeductus]